MNNNYQESTSQNMGFSLKQRPGKTKFVILSILGVIVLGIALYFLAPILGLEILKKKSNGEEDHRLIPSVFGSKFANYEEVLVDIKPKVPKYSVAPDLSNIDNISDFRFSEEAKNLLVKNAFVVVPSYQKEFFSIYESNRYNYIPSFITTDSILHNYHLMFDSLLKKLEEQRLIPELKELNKNMLAESLSQYNALKGTEWENAAKRNVGFFAVGGKLLDSSINIPSIVISEVKRELLLIENHEGIKDSPVMNIGSEGGATIDTPQGLLTSEALKEDYSQYIPRGHYNKSEELKSYFKSMMWYGRLTFRMKNDDEIKSALLITLALDKESNEARWDKIYEPINFFVGKSDDIAYYEFRELAEKIYEDNFNLKILLTDKNKFNSFVKASEVLEAPQINSMPIFEASFQEDREEEIKGFRFMGQRFTIDSSIFQRLIYREVGDKIGLSCEKYDPKSTNCLIGARCLPKGLDIPATMGSTEALNILKEMGEDKYTCYSENMSKMASYLEKLPIENWTQNLYWGWLYQLRPLLKEKGDGYPSFMQNMAWAKKELNTFLGSWAELKHDTILYAKQAYAELTTGGDFPEEKDDRGYVEPNPYVYARLAALLKMTNKGLEDRGLLIPAMKENLNKMENLAISLKIISEKELNNKELTDDEYELIRSYGGELEHFWVEINKEELEKSKTNKGNFLNDNPAAVIADVATDPNGSVLEVGTGNIFNIYAVVPIDGKLKITKGGVYSYYEFIHPMSDRLTDEKWHEMLAHDKALELPKWTSDFMAK